MKRNIRVLSGLVLATVAPIALAQTAGHSTVSYGASLVSPKSDVGTVADAELRIDDAAAFSFTYEHYVRNGLGLEVHALVPNKQHLSFKGTGTVGSYWSFSPSFLVQYHFNAYGAHGPVSPFIGAGLNYTTFVAEDGEDSLSDVDFNFKDSFGATAHAGIDIIFGERSALRVDARWTQMRSKIEIEDHYVGKAHIDPITYGVSYVIAY